MFATLIFVTGVFSSFGHIIMLKQIMLQFIVEIAVEVKIASVLKKCLHSMKGYMSVVCG